MQEPVLSSVVSLDSLLGGPLPHLLLEPLDIGGLGLDGLHELLIDTRDTKEVSGLCFLQGFTKTTLLCTWGKRGGDTGTREEKVGGVRKWKRRRRKRRIETHTKR